MRAWLFQDHRQKQKLGEKKCPWSVGWIDPDGKRRSKRIGSKSMAEKFRKKTEGELAAGTYERHSKKTWAEFRKEYEAKIASGMKHGTRKCTLEALGHFERITKPGRLESINTQKIDEFIARRRLEPGKKRGETMSLASVNKELRHIKAVLKIAHEWEYLSKVPKIRMLREPVKIPRYVTPEHFQAMYRSCDEATRPGDLPYPPGEWWRALLMFAYMTGWRISEVMALRREDLDLKEGRALTRAGDNKGGRDDTAPLHPVVVEHLERIPSLEPVVFAWFHNERMLYEQFHRIQEAAGIRLDCHGEHEHTSACHVYGFHDLRRAFATVNAESLSADELQALMRHKSYVTTQRYIAMAHRLKRSVAKLHVPDVLRHAN